MDDNKKAENEEPTEEGLDVSPAPEAEELKEEAEEPTPEATEEEESTGETDSPEEKSQDTSSKVVKPTRGQKRIKDLIGKLKGSDEEETPKMDVNELLGIDPNEPLIKPEEYTTGVDPQELERRQRAREVALEQRILQKSAINSSYRESIRDHASDAEATAKALKEDPDLDAAAAEYYENVNYTIDPYTGKKVFTPRLKMSSIVKKLQNIADKKAAAATSEVSHKLAAQKGDGVVRPTAGKQPKRKFADKSIEEMEAELGVIS